MGIVATLLFTPKQATPIALYHQVPTTKVVTIETTAKTVTPIAKAPQSEIPVPASVASVATPAPTPDPPVAIGNCATYLPLLSQYSWNVSVAVEVMQAESGCNPNQDTTGDYHPTCYGSRGLFQIGCDSTNNYEGMFDPATNIAQAYRLYVHRGWEPWSSTTCRYKVQCY